jgi:serine/threonine protein kinase
VASVRTPISSEDIRKLPGYQSILAEGEHKALFQKVLLQEHLADGAYCVLSNDRHLNWLVIAYRQYEECFMMCIYNNAIVIAPDSEITTVKNIYSDYDCTILSLHTLFAASQELQKSIEDINEPLRLNAIQKLVEGCIIQKECSYNRPGVPRTYAVYPVLPELGNLLKTVSELEEKNVGNHNDWIKKMAPPGLSSLGDNRALWFCGSDQLFKHKMMLSASSRAYALTKINLGSGVFGAVTLGLSSEGRPVAIKLFHHHSKVHTHHAYQSEVKNLKRINCFVDSFDSKEGHFLIKEFIEGAPLKIDSDTINRLNFESKIRLLISIASDLYHCHINDISHGDIAPRNILFNDITKTGRLIDIGSGLNARGMFAAPETSTAHAGSGATVFADRYALGVLISEWFAKLKYSTIPKPEHALLEQLINLSQQLKDKAANQRPCVSHVLKLTVDFYFHCQMTNPTDLDSMTMTNPCFPLLYERLEYFVKLTNVVNVPEKKSGALTTHSVFSFTTSRSTGITETIHIQRTYPQGLQDALVQNQQTKLIEKKVADDRIKEITDNMKKQPCIYYEIKASPSDSSNNAAINIFLALGLDGCVTLLHLPDERNREQFAVLTKIFIFDIDVNGKLTIQQKDYDCNEPNLMAHSIMRAAHELRLLSKTAESKQTTPLPTTSSDEPTTTVSLKS